MRNTLAWLRRHSDILMSAAFVPLAQDAYRNTRLATLYDSSQSLSTYLNSVFMIAISVGATIAVFRLAYAGYLRMGGGMWDSIDSRKKVKEMIRDVFIGLFLLLSVWIVLHQINPNILKLDFIFEAINIGAPAQPGTQTGTAPPAATGDQARLNRILADEQNVRRLIANTNQNIDINNGGLGTGWCTSVNQTSGCTNVGLLPTTMIERLDILQRACTASAGGGYCNIIITGGTEFWMHSTHGPGINVVDIRHGVIDSFITAQGTQTTCQVNGQTLPAYRLPQSAGGLKFCNENSAHWHVTM